ncbi:MAG: exodeoxyribonuclease VII large subunit [Bryobacteraceae bacterium]
MEQIRLEWGPGRETLTVSELTFRIRNLLGRTFSDVWISGEISGLKMAASGHAYFNLKDSGAQIRAACFRNTLRLLKFRPTEGMAALVRGRVDVYEPRGEYQLLVDWLEPQGAGALQAAFEQLKKRLEAEGLFDAGRKRPLPAFPRRIGIVTSRSGAVIRDMVNILRRRWPGAHVRLYPALVQGEGSVGGVVEGLEYFSRSGWADVVIVGRGGGSLEDLWTFNEEAVARAIVGCSAPVVSAVGHETDFTIADFVADLRAPTPSAAAELVVPSQADVLARIESGRRHLDRAMGLIVARKKAHLEGRGADRAEATVARRIGRASQRVDECEGRSIRAVAGGLRAAERRLAVLAGRLERASPRVRVAEAMRRWQGLRDRMGAVDPRVRIAALRGQVEAARQGGERAMGGRLAGWRLRWERAGARLETLSPVRILARGYAIVTVEGRVVRDSADAAVGGRVRVRLARGGLTARVEELE